MACSSMSADLVIAGYVYIAKQDLDGAEIAARFQIDISKPTGPAGKSDPIR